MTSDPLRIWAPAAHSVTVVIGSATYEAVPKADGWFELPDELAPGVDYRLSLDGSVPLPDPRSRWQPSGVDGPSRTVDHTSFNWTDDGWAGVSLDGLTIYELHVGTFTPEGTFGAAISKIGHLQRLGVGAVELMPFAQFPGRWGWGYDAVQLYAPFDGYGSPDDLKRFVDACHRAGIAVIADVVDNHLGPVGNTLQRFGPYLSRLHSTPWGAGFNLDEHLSGPVRDFLIGAALQWLDEYRMDGLRLDAVQAIHDSSAVHIVEEIALRVEELSARTARRKLVIAETDEAKPQLTSPRERGGWGLDGQWAEDFHRVLHTMLTSESHGYYGDAGGVSELERVVVDGVFASGGHSESRARPFGRPWGARPRHEMVAYLQSHDAVGNRPKGERLCHLAPLDLAKAAAVILMTLPHTPMIFQGEEWAASSPFHYFVDLPDERVMRRVRRGRTHGFKAMGLSSRGAVDPADEAAFLASRLDWKEPEIEPHSSVLALYRDLISLRRRERTSESEGEITFNSRESGVFSFTRGPSVTAVNLSGQATQIDRVTALEVASHPGCRLERSCLTMPPGSAAVISRSG